MNVWKTFLPFALAACAALPVKAGLIYQQYDTVTVGIPSSITSDAFTNHIDLAVEDSETGEFFFRLSTDLDPTTKSVSFDASSLDFDLFVRALTDNRSTFIIPMFYMNNDGPGGFGRSIADYVDSTDLYGHEIDKIRITLEGTQFVSPGTVFDDDFTDVYYMWSFQVYGSGDPLYLAERPTSRFPEPPPIPGNDGEVAVPEPASVALLAAGLFGLGFVRRRK